MKHTTRGYHGHFAKRETLSPAHAREGWSVLGPFLNQPAREAEPHDAVIRRAIEFQAAHNFVRRQALLDQAVRNVKNWPVWEPDGMAYALREVDNCSHVTMLMGLLAEHIRAEFARLAAAPRP